MPHLEAYEFAKDNPGCDIEEYQKVSCQDPYFAYLFALDIPSANIEYCQRYACKNPLWSFYFARDISETDIEYCYNNSSDEKKGFEELILFWL